MTGVSAEQRAPVWPASVGEAWSAVPEPTLCAFLAARLADEPDALAVVFEDGLSLTRRQLRDGIERLAAGLASSVRRGDRVVLAIGNRAEHLFAHFAIVANRGVVVAVSPSIGKHDASHVLRSSTATLAIAEASPADVLDAAAREHDLDCRTIRVDGAEPHGLAHCSVGTERADLASVVSDPGDLTGISYTSGTTGLPKALPSTHLELLRYTDVFLRTVPFGREDRVLCSLQFHYGDPLWLLFASLHRRVALIVLRRFSVSRFWDVAREHGATQILTIGSIPNLLLTAEPSPAERDHRVHRALAVGVPPAQHAELVERFGFPWVECYGSSESGPAISMPHDVADCYVGTGALGIPVPEVRARLVDEDGSPVDAEGSGELELDGLVLFDGYLDSPEADAEVRDGEWLRTGDLMRRDADGVFSFLGRRKELIRRGGENVAPAEVEAVLRLHPQVIDAAVVPVADALRGEEIKAYVEVRPGEVVHQRELADFCAARLAPHKVPRYVELRFEPLPRTPSQRVPKRELMVDGMHRVDTSWDREAP